MAPKKKIRRRAATKKKIAPWERASRAFVGLKLLAPPWSRNSDPMVRLTGWLVSFTALLGVVAGLQWCTLEKTDKTLKAA
jgi:hypothetical protein